MSFSTLDTVDQADRTPVSGMNANVYHPRLSDALALATKNRSRSKRSLNAKYDQILGSVKGRATSLFAKKSESERGRDGETFAGLSSIPFPRSYGIGSKVKLASLASQTRRTLPNRRNGGLFSNSISARPIILQQPPTYSPTPSNNNSEPWHARQDGSNLLYTPKTEAFEPVSYSTPYLDQQVESKTEDYHEFVEHAQPVSGFASFAHREEIVHSHPSLPPRSDIYQPLSPSPHPSMTLAEHRVHFQPSIRLSSTPPHLFIFFFHPAWSPAPFHNLWLHIKATMVQKEI
ncbi:hypothetical protein J005_04393 [Cryptococcus neoformans]|nr:hypothetical protein C344_04273 [Cryptococcus neoformans var. grubii AD1-7a]OXG30063.1 hypothetical protein C360_05276 [Cryptococcus neoformans var. grubii Bt15]OXH29324.1 hypothetical protein J005_04393 [Cryptococcus neoformans var. grubii]